MAPERAFELLAIRREQVAAKGGAAPRSEPRQKPAAQEVGAAKKSGTAKKSARQRDRPSERSTATADRHSLASPGVGQLPPYIAFEGPEGTGKSTHAALLADALGAVLTRETGGTAIGERLRRILHDNEVDNLEWRAEALITAADRAQHVAEVVIPALRSGRTVVSDRSVYSTLAYQGYGRGLDLDELRTINDWAVQGVWPIAGGAGRRAIRRRRRPAQRPAARSVRTRRRRVPRAGAGRLPSAGRRRPRPLDRDLRRRGPRTRSPTRSSERCAGSCPNRAPMPDSGSIWAGVVGQDAAVEALVRASVAPVHAYLFVGPPGSTKDEAARSFAAALLTGDDDRASRDARLILAGEHPDVREVMRVGPAISKEQAGEIVRQAALAPVEGDRKVLILARVPPPRRGRRRATPEDDRGAAGVDALRRARRLRPCRLGDDRVALRPDRVQPDRRGGADGAARRRGRRQRRTPPRPQRPPAATSTEPGFSSPTPSSPNAAARSPVFRRRSTARVRRWCPPSPTCSAGSRRRPRR